MRRVLFASLFLVALVGCGSGSSGGRSPGYVAPVSGGWTDDSVRDVIRLDRIMGDNDRSLSR